MKKLLVILSALAMGLTASAQKSTVNCTFNGLEGDARVIVSNAQGGRLVPVDTLTPNAKGLVSISRQVADPTMMVLSLNKKGSPMLHLLSCRSVPIPCHRTMPSVLTRSSFGCPCLKMLAVLSPRQRRC